MAAEVHAAVENPNHVDVGSDLSVEDHVRAHGEFEIARANVLAGTTSSGIFGDGRDGVPDHTQVHFGLVDTPTLEGVAADLPYVRAGARREDVAHAFSASGRRGASPL